MSIKNKKKKKGYVPRPIGKGEMVDVGRTFSSIPGIRDFEKEVMRLSKTDNIGATYVHNSYGGIYKAVVNMMYQGKLKLALFLLVRRTVMGRPCFQMTRIFLDNDPNEGGIFDLFEARLEGLKGVEYHVQA